uniref:Large ribosomal subunit protein bL17m n=1 Tax=Pavo cristatus TaxID=9049 RepID=A0A8C9FUC0_PAVCR
MPRGTPHAKTTSPGMQRARGDALHCPCDVTEAGRVAFRLARRQQGGGMRLSLVAAISHGRVYRRLGHGPRSRLDLLRNLVTALVRHERIEAPWARADEMRGYAERLIDYAKRGDTDERAMRMADFWLTVGSPQPLTAPVRRTPGLSVPTRRRRTSSTSCSKCWRPDTSRTPAATPACCTSPTGTAWTVPRWL